MLRLCSYNAAKFSLKNKAILFSPASKWFYSFLIYGNYILSYMRKLFYVIGFIYLYCLKLYPHKI